MKKINSRNSKKEDREDIDLVFVTQKNREPANQPANQPDWQTEG